MAETQKSSSIFLLAWFEFAVEAWVFRLTMSIHPKEEKEWSLNANQLSEVMLFLGRLPPSYKHEQEYFLSVSFSSDHIYNG